MNKIIINGKELTWNELAKIIGEKEVEKIEITTEFPDGELKLSFDDFFINSLEIVLFFNFFTNLYKIIEINKIIGTDIKAIIIVLAEDEIK